MKRVTINVTAEDIAKGEPMKPSSCPVARAARRAGFGMSLVGSRDIRYGFWRVGYVVLPESARQFIVEHDSGLRVEPFSFEVVR